MTIPDAIRALIDKGPLAHVVTIDDDGSPHVTMAWIGIEDDEVVFGTLPEQRKLDNIRRDGRVSVSFETDRQNSYGMQEYVVMRGHARVTPGGGMTLLKRLAKVYLGPDAQYGWPGAPDGYVTRISVDRVTGMGPWRDGPRG